MPWDYSNGKVEPYGDTQSYIRAAQFLGDGPVEDWGCGMAYAKRFFGNGYKGIDGAPGHADVVADLVNYTSKVHGILLRHVLEHNVDWRQILRNAVHSAEKKLVIVLFTPMKGVTQQIDWNPGYEVPDISFCRQDLLIEIEPHFWVEEWEKSPGSKYKEETTFYVTKR